MKNNYLLIHGSFGSLFVNWFPYLRKEIENKNLEVYTTDFSTAFLNCQKLSILKAMIHSFLCKIKLTFIIGVNNYLDRVVNLQLMNFGVIFLIKEV